MTHCVLLLLCVLFSILSGNAAIDVAINRSCKKGRTAETKHPYPYPLITPNSKSRLNVPYLCDTKTDGGGWILIQRRTTGNINFDRDWNDYKLGFGSLNDDFWLGNENIHTLTAKGEWELRVDLKADNGKSGFAHYKNFYLEDELNAYTLHVGEFDGSISDSLAKHNNIPFSTYDVDNDPIVNVNCAFQSGGDGGWWYHDRCDTGNLNAIWNEEYRAVEWKDFTESIGTDLISLTFSEMKVRRMK